MIKSRYFKKRPAKPLTVEAKAYDEFVNIVPASYNFEVKRAGAYLEFRTIGEHAAEFLTEILPVKYDGLDVIVVYEEIRE